MRAIYCAGEEGRVVRDILERIGGVGEVVFVDDDKKIKGKEIDGCEVIGDVGAMERLNQESDAVIVAFGDEQGTRIKLAERVRELGFDLFNAVHPDATIAATATLGEGIIVNAQTYVGPGAVLDDLTLLDSEVNLSHDVRVDLGATIGPNATLAGGVTVGRDAYIGAGATIIDDITIGQGAVVGAGAVVIDHVEPGSTVVGNPAEPMS